MPANQTKAESTTMMIAVRINVARSLSTPWMPILAKIAVSAAKTADSTAQKNQLFDDAMAVPRFECKRPDRATSERATPEQDRSDCQRWR